MDAEHPPFTARTTRLLSALLVPLVLLLVAGAISLASSGDGVRLEAGGERLDAVVTARLELACEGTAPEVGITCVRPEVQLDGGGRAVLAEQTAEDAAGIDVGDEVVVTRTPSPTGEVTFELAGRQRGPAPSYLAVAAAVLLLVVARRRGLQLLVALAVAALVLVLFALPALLDGGDPTAVGVVAGGLVALALAVLGRGLGARSATALIVTLLGIGIAGLVGDAVAGAASLAGLDPGFEVAEGELPLAGLLLAGIVVGAAGALLDLTTRVVDATWDLRETSQGWWSVAAAGLRRSQGAAADVTSTLLVAYAGAALPLLVLLRGGGGMLDELGNEALAAEGARALVGAVALLLAVPLAVALAALVVVREARAGGHGDPRRFQSRHERDLWADEG